MINEERLLDRFLKYVQIDSPSREERDLALILKKELSDLGFEVYMDDAGDKLSGNSGNLIGYLDGNGSNPILLSSHMDTVSPSRGVKPIIKDGIIYSDGTTVLGGDNKAGIAAIMEALESLVENKLDHGPIEVVFSVYEEGGLNGAKNLDFTKIKSKEALVFDSGGDPGEIIIQGPGQYKITIDFYGKSAHAGVAPEEGISAIEMLAYAVSNMKLLRIDEETTANLGLVQGGEASNIVMEKLRVVGEARSLDKNKLDKQVEHMKKVCEDTQEKFKGRVDFREELSYGSFKIEEDDPFLERVKSALEGLDLKPYTSKSGGGSDTNIFNLNGIKAVNLGIGEKKPHSLEEHIHIKDLNMSARMALKLIEKFGQEKE